MTLWMTTTMANCTLKDDAPGRASRGLAGLLAAAALGAALWAAPPAAHAGRQIEEPLANAVRTALSAVVSRRAPPVPVFADAQRKVAFDHWVQASEARLLKRKPDGLVRREFLQTVWYEATRAGLDPTLVLGLIEVESGFRKHAISSAGARGYMQIMPFWTRSIGDGDASTLFHMQTNLRFGCVILRHYLDIEKGNLFLALGRYNGSRGKPQYPNAVFAAWNRWKALTAAPNTTLAQSEADTRQH